MRHIASLRMAWVSALVLAAGLTSSATASLLADPGFDDPNIPLVPFGAVVNPLTPGHWGVELASKVTAENGVTPHSGNYMLRMNPLYEQTQAWQAVDLSADAALIDAGDYTITFGAWYNMPASGAGARAIASVLTFPQGADWPQYELYVEESLDVDGDPTTWEYTAVTVTLPVGTRSILVHVSWVGSTMNNTAGYVDSASLVVPEPASAALLAVGLLLAARRR